MALTRYGVCYDLRETPFVASYGDMEFRFSTRAHSEKFMDEVGTRVRWLNDSLSRRFHVTVRASELAAVQLYQMIENRGFLVRVREEWFECPGDLAFRGRLTSAGDSQAPSAPSTEPLLG